MVPYMFAVIWIFFCFRKNYHPVVWTKHSSKYCLKTLTNHKIVNRHSKWIALLMVYFGNLWDRIALMLTQVHGSYIYWYTRKTLGTKLLTIENYIFLLMFLWFSVVVFSLLLTMSIFASVFHRIYVCFYFFGDYESSVISWTSNNNWFLKFSLTQTKRKCKAFHFT